MVVALAERIMSVIAPFPHEYTVSLADGLLMSEPRPAIPAGAPPQFGGVDTVWSPEELVVGAVLLCIKTTFDAYAKHASLEFHNWSGKGLGILEKSASGPTFSSVQLQLQFQVAAGDEEKARKLLGTSERHCIISQLIKAPVTIEASITTP